MATLVSDGLGFCRIDFEPVKDQLEIARANTCMNDKQPVSFPGWKSEVDPKERKAMLHDARHWKYVLKFRLKPAVHFFRHQGIQLN